MKKIKNFFCDEDVVSIIKTITDALIILFCTRVLVVTELSFIKIVILLLLVMTIIVIHFKVNNFINKERKQT